MEKITSISNGKVKNVAALQQRGKTRREQKAFVTEGTRLFLDTPVSYLKEVYVTEAFLEETGDKKTGSRLQELERAGVLCIMVTPEVMKHMADTQTPQGVLCVNRMPSWDLMQILQGTAAEGEMAGTAGTDGKKAKDRKEQVIPKEQGIRREQSRLLLLLEDIQDPGNLGTMFRSAEAAGAAGVIMSKGTADIFNPKTVRSTMSAIFRMPFYYAQDFGQTLRQIQEAGFGIYAAHLEGAVDYDRCDYTAPSAFLIGNEGRGLSAAVTAKADQRILIPMEGEIESLNAAVAASVLLFEAARQKRDHSRLCR